MSVAITGSRMSASMKSVSTSPALGRRVSRPTTYSHSGARSRRRARADPIGLPTPVMSTRRPATSAGGRAAAGLRRGRRTRAARGETRLDHVEAAGDFAQLGREQPDVLLGGGQPVLHL